nr:hypothetical protein [Jeotgalibacillus malaysiensis]
MIRIIRITENIFLALFIVTTILSLIFRDMTLLSLLSKISFAGWITVSGSRFLNEGKKNAGKVVVSLGLLLFFLSFI